jgi:20S proteasome alpha/beta subunit
MTVEEGIELVKKCIHELHVRFLISQPNFFIKIVDKDGIREIKL